MRRPLPAHDWGAAVGDIVHNTRSALDNLVFALADANAGPPPPEPIIRPSPWSYLQFPVVDHRSAWPRAVRQNLQGVGSRDQAAIERVQPFHRRRPQRYWLWMLNYLWNRDKHRTIALVHNLIGWRNIHVDIYLPDEDRLLLREEVEAHFAVRLVRRSSSGPFEGDAKEIARFRLDPRGGAPLPPNARMDVQVQLATDIAFDRGPLHGKLVIPTLQDLLARTMALLAQFQSKRCS